MTLGVWLRLLARNQFAISVGMWPVALVVTAVSSLNSVLALIQSLLLGRRIRASIAHGPIFILGHWRSGTTLLHNLMVQDERFAFPTAYECFAPKFALVSGSFVRRFLGFLCPKRRSMDNFANGLDLPHEDEFALCNLGLGSPYEQMGFPNRTQGEDYLDFSKATQREVQRWKAGLVGFLQQVTWRAGGKTVVLKSPTHTARVRLLLEQFPDARFVHIVRDPHSVFPSTLRLWKAVYRSHGLQTPDYSLLEARVYRTLKRMYRAYQEEKQLIPPGNLCEVRYECLVRDPLVELRAIYTQLGLGDFDRVRPKLEAFIATQQDYQTNQHDVSLQQSAEIGRQWETFICDYNYVSSVNVLAGTAA